MKKSKVNEADKVFSALQAMEAESPYKNANIQDIPIAAPLEIFRPRFRRRLVACGVAFVEAITGFTGTGSRGYRPNRVLVARMRPGDAKAIARKAMASARATSNARKARKNKRESLAEKIGCLPDARVLQWYLRDDITLEEAQRIAAKTRARHENTNYESYLAKGVSKDDARSLAEDEQ